MRIGPDINAETVIGAGTSFCLRRASSVTPQGEASLPSPAATVSTSAAAPSAAAPSAVGSSVTGIAAVACGSCVY